MFYWVSLGFTGFCWVSFCVSWFVHQFDHVSPGIVGFHQLLPPENGFKHSFVCPLAVRPIGQQRGRKRSSQGKTKRQQVACGKQWHTRPPPNPERFFPSETKHDDIMGNGRHTHTQKETKRATDHGSSQEIVVSPMGGTRPSLACHRVQLLVTEAHHHHHHHPPPPPPPSIRHQTLDFHPSPYHPLILSFT